MARLKEHGALVDAVSDGSIIIAPRSGKGTTHQGPLNTALDAGANDTYVIALSFPLASYMVGQELAFKANTANTGAATLNVNGLGAKTIKKVAGGITTDLATNDIRAGQYVKVMYDGTNFQMLSASGNASATSGDIPVKATGAEIITGTDDDKFATAKAIKDALITSGVKRYVALLTQTGTDAPVATVLENTLGGTVTWSRTGAGTYAVIGGSLFTANKTVAFVTNYTAGNIVSAGYNSGEEQFELITFGQNVGTQLFEPQDDLLQLMSLTIFVYP